MTVGFIGLGLIGGSIAKALKKADRNIIIIAFNRSKSSLEAALLDNTIDIAATDFSQFNECDFVFLCTPVELNSVYLEKLKPYVKKGAIISDVGSVKGYIHHTVKELGMEDCFIGGHPMAGSERTGYNASKDTLCENAFFAITPTPLTTKEMLDSYIDLVKMIKALPVVLDYELHDRSVAGISHLPHVIAASLVNLVKHSDNEHGTMKLLAAGGFKDITRIASSSADMWEQICTTNTESISTLLSDYIASLEDFKKILDAKDHEKLNAFFSEARQYRDSVSDAKKGPILKEYVVHCNIVDHEGALLEVITKLTKAHIDIKGISIVNNRDSEAGVLKLSLASEADIATAKSLLSDIVAE